MFLITGFIQKISFLEQLENPHWPQRTLFIILLFDSCLCILLIKEFMSNSVHLGLCQYICPRMWQDYLLAAKEEKMLTQMTLNSRLNFNNKSGWWMVWVGHGEVVWGFEWLAWPICDFLLYSVELDCISLFGEILFNKWARGRWRDGDNTPPTR